MAFHFFSFQVAIGCDYPIFSNYSNIEIKSQILQQAQIFSLLPLSRPACGFAYDITRARLADTFEEAIGAPIGLVSRRRRDQSERDAAGSFRWKN